MTTPTPAVDPATSTASPLTRALGTLALVGVAATAWLGLVASPRDRVQLDSVRLMYVHVPAVTWMYVAVLVCALASGMWLRKRTDGWDVLAGASASARWCPSPSWCSCCSPSRSTPTGGS